MLSKSGFPNMIPGRMVRCHGIMVDIMRPLSQQLLVFMAILYSISSPSVQLVEGSEAMKRLYEDLFTDYNRLILPMAANKTKVSVTVGLKLGQILDLNLKQQILSTNVWVEQAWYDHRLEWDPKAYGGIDMVHVPAENIWIPDIVLFNNADGNYELTLIAKAVLYSDGLVVWKPPTMFRSTCEIDVEYFPFDIQTCFLRFGSWSYAGDEVDIMHVGKKRKVDIGIDLSQFYKNVEWDIIDVPAYYNEVTYEGRDEPFQDITFKIVIRRKMLFYLVNLILPVALMTFMTVSVFYLPADSNEKVTLSISILTSLIVFFLLMLEVIPPTSLAVPLFGKYLLFTLVLVSLSACVSVYVLNIYHRAPSVHQMSPQMRQLFLKTLPRLLRLDRPDPRERSSLNRFRKKKLAQQILQQRKVYDLVQPLAASLNLIETLQKSYDFNPRDDEIQKAGSKKSKAETQTEEGRYFRRYVDNYLDRLQAQASKGIINGSNAASSNKHRAKLDHHSKQSSSSSMNTRQPAAAMNRCSSEHDKLCCSSANKPLRQSSLQRQNCRPTQMRSNATTTITTTCNLSTNNQFGLRESSKNCDHQTSFITHQANINDDTFDMTFDYDEQDGTAMQSTQAQMLAATECDLPSPPPPPRQLAKLSDSMKDLSGRLSSCSQKASVKSQLSRDEEEDDVNDDDGQLVDKLISSINLINNNSDDIDSQTTTSLTNNEQYPSCNLATLISHGPTLLLPTSRGYTRDLSLPDGNHRQAPDMNDCTCTPGGNQFHDAHENLQAANHVRGVSHQFNSNEQCNYRGPRDSQAGGAPHRSSMNWRAANEQTPSRQQSQAKAADSLDGMGHIPTTNPSELLISLRLPYDQMPDHVRAAIRSILFIADTIKNEDDENSAIEDWESMSMVVDRLFLWIFFLLCTFGSLIILALAPSLYDQRDSIDDKLRIEIPASNCTVVSTSKN